MKKLILSSIIGATLALSVGCTGLASVAKQMKNDPAFVTVEIKTIYGSGVMVRDGRANSANTISVDGAVTSIPGTNSNFAPQAVRQAQGLTVTPEQFQAMVREQAAKLNAPPLPDPNAPTIAKRVRAFKTNENALLPAPVKPVAPATPNLSSTNQPVAKNIP